MNITKQITQVTLFQPILCTPQAVYRLEQSSTHQREEN
jgi:hypothetical protein